MINEVAEVQEYLKGEKIDKENLYRICYLLCKWYKQQGLSRIQIREALFAWGKEQNVYIQYNVNDIIDKVFEDKKPLKTGRTVKISTADIDEINRRFDNKKTKLVALAMLCYAKANADKDKEFSVSSVALGAWLGIHRSTIKRKHIKELADYDYLKIVQTPKNTFTWEASEASKSCRYHMNVDLRNSGECVLQDNNITELYERAFS